MSLPYGRNSMQMTVKCKAGMCTMQPSGCDKAITVKIRHKGTSNRPGQAAAKAYFLQHAWHASCRRMRSRVEHAWTRVFRSSRERGGCARINLSKLAGHARFAYRRRADLYRVLVMGEIAGLVLTCLLRYWLHCVCSLGRWSFVQCS